MRQVFYVVKFYSPSDEDDVREKETEMDGRTDRGRKEERMEEKERGIEEEGDRVTD